jgi:tetraacyldisaccharide 4'-kinase
MLSAAEWIYAREMQRRRARWQNAPQKIEDCRLVSVGNLSVGGTGKTPAMQFLVRHFQGREKRVAIVARGYGGTLSRPGAIVSDGNRVLISAREAGDEPLLHARALPEIPVLIGRDRVAAARKARDEFGAQIVILDDAFQFWSLARDLDLVLLDVRRPLDNGHLLPRGRLREEPEALRRASGILLTRADAATPEQLSATRTLVEKYSTAPLWQASHAPQALRDERSGTVSNLEELRGRKVIAISALADNAQFFQTLRNCGASVAGHVARRDHHRWREGEVKSALALAQKQGAALVTTEKDAVKWLPGWIGGSPVEVWSVQIALRLKNEVEFAAWLDAALP